MAGQNQVLLTFAGDASKLDRTFKDVGAGAATMGNEVGRGAEKLDRLGEAGGNTESAFLGLGAGISGVSTLMSGDAGPEDYAMAIADLGDSIEHFVIPAIKNFGLGMLTTAQTAVTTAATHAASAASVVAGWVAMGFHATVNAAKMAAAWLISLGPVALVIAAVVAVIAILAALGVRFDDLKRWAGAAWNFVKSSATSAASWVGTKVGEIIGFFASIPGKIGGFFSGLASTIMSPFTSAFSAIRSAWNSTAGGFGFSTPSWLPGIGGKSFRIPEMHTGGIVSGPPGSDQLRMLQAGERVIPANKAMGAPTVNIYVQGSIRSDRDLVQLVRDELDRGGFGGLQ